MTDSLEMTGGGLTEADAVARIARAGVQPHELADGLFVFTDPVDGGTTVIDRKDYEDVPGQYGDLNINAYDTQSFIAVVRDLSAWQARVYADPARFRAVGILNDDSVDMPGRRNRKVTMQCVNTPQWEAWTKHDDELMGQVKFSEFIEDHIEDISSLTGADLLEIAQSIEATKSTQFKSAHRLSNGQRKFTHDETISATGGEDGDLEIPDTFEITLSPWVGFDANPYKVTVKLRYRLGQSGLQLGYHMVGVQQILDSAFLNDVVAPIKNAELWTVLGTP